MFNESEIETIKKRIEESKVEAAIRTSIIVADRPLKIGEIRKVLGLLEINVPINLPAYLKKMSGYSDVERVGRYCWGVNGLV